MCRKNTTTDVISSFSVPIISPIVICSPSAFVTIALRIDLESFNNTSSISDGTSHGCWSVVADKNVVDDNIDGRLMLMLMLPLLLLLLSVNADAVNNEMELIAAEKKNVDKTTF